LHADITRGGLATVLNEISSASNCGIEIHEAVLPISNEVRELNPLISANMFYCLQDEGLCPTWYLPVSTYLQYAIIVGIHLYIPCEPSRAIRYIFVPSQHVSI